MARPKKSEQPTVAESAVWMYIGTEGFLFEAGDEIPAGMSDRPIEDSEQ